MVGNKTNVFWFVWFFRLGFALQRRRAIWLHAQSRVLSHAAFAPFGIALFLRLVVTVHNLRRALFNTNCRKRAIRTDRMNPSAITAVSSFGQRFGHISLQSGCPDN